MLPSDSSAATDRRWLEALATLLDIALCASISHFSAKSLASVKEVCLAANHFLDVLSADMVCDARAAVSAVSCDRCAAGTDACWTLTHTLISAGLTATVVAAKLGVATAEAGTLIAVALA